MSMENIRDLFLEDETFEDARQKFNTVLQRLFHSMIDTESNEGSITLKNGRFNADRVHSEP